MSLPQQRLTVSQQCRKRDAAVMVEFLTLEPCQCCQLLIAPADLRAASYVAAATATVNAR
jgi:hypothetical protein